MLPPAAWVVGWVLELGVDCFKSRCRSLLLCVFEAFSVPQRAAVSGVCLVVVAKFCLSGAESYELGDKRVGRQGPREELPARRGVCLEEWLRLHV